VLFERSWYNRAGVEKVMDFCSDEQHIRLLKEVPSFEQLLADDGIILLKYRRAADQEEQEARFAEHAAAPFSLPPLAGNPAKERHRVIKPVE